MALIGIGAFMLGTIIGSFLNVVVLRLGSGRSVTGRSACLSCGTTLEAVDLVPILSYLFLRGRCRRCGSRMSAQYPLVELATGILFLLVALLPFSPYEMIYLAILVSLLVAIAAYDIRHKIVPDVLVYPFIALALLHAAFAAFIFIPATPFALYVVSGFSFALPLVLIWYLSHGRAMGLGDGKLALGLGFMLGPIGTISAFVFSFWSGALVGVALIAIQRVALRARGKALTMKSEIPFAPFLIFGAMLVKLLGVELPLF